MHLLATAVLALGLLVILHEAGHFLAARACGMRVDVFSIGFGPALVSYQGRYTEYRLSLVPLGGYVRIAGMSPGDFPPGDPTGFLARPWWQRLLVLLAGPFLNWALAFALLAGLYAVGYPVPTDQPVIEEVPGAHAAAAGLMPGDRVLAAGDSPVASWGTLVHVLAAHPGEPLALRIERSGVELKLTARVGADGRLGITPQTRTVRFPVREAFSLALVKTGELSRMMLRDLRDAVQSRGEVQVMGPVGLVSETVEAVRRGYFVLLFVLVQISLALALMNLLPLPALDGGRLVFVLVSAIRRRPVDMRVEAAIHALGVVALLGLVLWVSWSEVRRFALPVKQTQAAEEARR